MLISKQNFLKLRNEIKLERIYNIVVAVMIIFMLMLAFIALQRPITASQHQVISIYHMWQIILKRKKWRIVYYSIRM